MVTPDAPYVDVVAVAPAAHLTITPDAPYIDVVALEPTVSATPNGVTLTPSAAIVDVVAVEPHAAANRTLTVDSVAVVEVVATEPTATNVGAGETALCGSVRIVPLLRGCLKLDCK